MPNFICDFYRDILTLQSNSWKHGHYYLDAWPSHLLLWIHNEGNYGGLNVKKELKLKNIASSPSQLMPLVPLASSPITSIVIKKI